MNRRGAVPGPKAKPDWPGNSRVAHHANAARHEQRKPSAEILRILE